MEPIIVPEIILLNAYKLALRFIRRDYETYIATPSSSYLGKILGSTNALQRYTLLEQAKSVFVTTENDPRHIDVNVFFNAARAAIPTIHITNPAEIPIHDSINIGMRVQDPEFNDADGTYTEVFNRRFKSKYQIVITSDNTNEVVLIYNVMKSMTISLIEHLHLSGLENIKISGQDISLKSDLIPSNIFIKSIGLEFEVDCPALKLSTTDFAQATDVLFTGTILEPD